MTEKNEEGQLIQVAMALAPQATSQEIRSRILSVIEFNDTVKKEKVLNQSIVSYSFTQFAPSVDSAKESKTLTYS